jgi:S1-C subfamily serine protease
MKTRGYLTPWLLSLLLLGSFTAAMAQPGHHWQHAPTQPRIGVLVEAIPLDELDSLQLEYGVRIVQVAPDGPAHAAGLQPGDIITRVDRRPVYGAERLRWLLAQVAAGDEAIIEFERAGKTHRTKVKPAGTKPRGLQQDSPPAYLGVQLQTLTDELREVFSAPQGTGMLVAQVGQDTPAAKAGIQVGDVLTAIAGKTVRNMRDIRRILSAYDPGDRLNVELIRDKQRKTLTVTLESNPDLPSRQGWWPPGGESMPDLHQWREHMDEMMDRLKDFWEALPKPDEAGENSYL